MRILGIVALGAALGGGAFQRAEVAQQAQARRDRNAKRAGARLSGRPRTALLSLVSAKKLDDLPEWDWYDNFAHLRCTRLGRSAAELE